MEELKSTSSVVSRIRSDSYSPEIRRAGSPVDISGCINIVVSSGDE